LLSMSDIVWPERYTPGTTDNYVSNEIIVAGLTAADVRPYLNNTSAWLARLVEALGREVGPAFFLENQTVKFVIPENFQGLPLSVVIRTREADNESLSGTLWFDHLIDEPTSRADLHQFADRRDTGSLPSDRAASRISSGRLMF
jgi:hypothetical protein